jgi:hypothetical protein
MTFETSQQQVIGDAVIRVLVALAVGGFMIGLPMASLVIAPQPIPAFFGALLTGLGAAFILLLAFRPHWRRLRLDDNAIVLEDGRRALSIDYREVDVVAIGGLDNWRSGTPLRIRRGWREFRIWLSTTDMNACLAALRVRCAHAAIVPESGHAIFPDNPAARSQAQQRLATYRGYQRRRRLLRSLLPSVCILVAVLLANRERELTRREIFALLLAGSLVGMPFAAFSWVLRDRGRN